MMKPKWKKPRMLKVFWDKFEKIVCQIVPEIERLSEMIEIQKLSKKIVPESERVSEMTEIQKLSEEVHEKIIRQILPDASDDQVDFIVCDYSQISPFCYAHWRDGLMEVSTKGIKEIDKVYKEVAKIVIDHPNPLGVVVFAEIGMFGRDEDEYLARYYMNKYVRTHEHAMEMWGEKVASERRAFEKTLKAWVGLFVPDESVSEHYYQIVSHALSPYSIRERKPKRML